MAGYFLVNSHKKVTKEGPPRSLRRPIKKRLDGPLRFSPAVPPASAISTRAIHWPVGEMLRHPCLDPRLRAGLIAADSDARRSRADGRNIQRPHPKQSHSNIKSAGFCCAQFPLPCDHQGVPVGRGGLREGACRIKNRTLAGVCGRLRCSLGQLITTPTVRFDHRMRAITQTAWRTWRAWCANQKFQGTHATAQNLRHHSTSELSISNFLCSALWIGHLLAMPIR